MCYANLREMDPERQSVGDMIVQTRTSALNTGALAAAFVLAGLLLQGAAAPVVVAQTAGAFVLGMALSVAVVVALAGLARARARTGLPVPSPSRHH